jgi:hypothetical protein
MKSNRASDRVQASRRIVTTKKIGQAKHSPPTRYATHSKNPASFHVQLKIAQICRQTDCDAFSCFVQKVQTRVRAASVFIPCGDTGIICRYARE